MVVERKRARTRRETLHGAGASAQGSGTEIRAKTTMRPISRFVKRAIDVLTQYGGRAMSATRRGTVKVRFDITVPEGTPPDASIYVSGSLRSLGNWKAAGLQAKKIAEHRYVASIELPVGQAIEFKVTRGTWRTVEIYSSGYHRPNRFR